MKTKVLLVTMVTVVAMVASIGAWAHEEGSDSCEGEGSTYAKHARMPMLTPEQREEVKAKVAEMEEAGARPEEVREAVADMLKAWGIERPQRGANTGDRVGILQQLTPEQREQLQGKTAELREQGATPQEIREAVGDLLQGWGIQPGAGQGGQQAAPPRWGQRGMGMMQQGQRGMGMMQQRGQQAAPSRWGQQGPAPQWGQQAAPHRWGQQAPPSQWGQQVAPSRWGQRGMGMMQQQRGQQAAPHRWGQQAPPPYWGQQAAPPHWGQQAGPPRWGQPASPPQWGQQGPPPQWGQQQQAWRGQQGRYGQQAQRSGWQMMMQRLTPEQREEVRATVKELHEEGVEPQEIREALRDLLEGWGIAPKP